MNYPTVQKLSLLSLTALVVGSMIGAGGAALCHGAPGTRGPGVYPGRAGDLQRGGDRLRRGDLQLATGLIVI